MGSVATVVEYTLGMLQYVSENASNIICLYGDDIAVGATTVKDLQDMTVLELYCSKWGLIVNQSKTKNCDI